MEGGDLSNNSAHGFNWQGQQYVTLSTYMGKTVMSGTIAHNNGDFGIWFSAQGTNDTILPDANVVASVYDNSGLTGAYVDVNMLNEIGWKDSTSMVKNLNSYRQGTAHDYIYVTGLREVDCNHTSLQTLTGGTHNQILQVRFNKNVTVVHNGGNISLNTAANTSYTENQTITLRYDEPDDKWYELSIGTTNAGDLVISGGNEIVHYGPTTGSAAVSKVVTRSVSTTANDYTNIGTVSFDGNGGGFVKITVATSAAGFSASATYLISQQYANSVQGINSTWLECIPIAGHLKYSSNELALDAYSSNATIAFRLRRVGGANASNDVIHIEAVGKSTTITESSTPGS